MRIKFMAGDGDYTKVFLDGYDIGVFHYDDPEKGIAKMIEQVYKRAWDEAILDQQRKLKELLGVKNE